MKKGHIAIEGLPGVGKTFLCEALATSDHLPEYEYAEEGAATNLFLPLYYGDPSRWALSFQLSILASRSADAVKGVSNPTLYDRSLFGDYALARASVVQGLMTSDEWRLY